MKKEREKKTARRQNGDEHCKLLHVKQWSVEDPKEMVCIYAQKVAKSMEMKLRDVGVGRGLRNREGENTTPTNAR